MDAQQEFQRLKQAFKKREQKRQNIYIANVVDITPRAESGYIVVRLKDGTQVYAHVWMTEQISVGQVVFIIPITQEAWNWFVVVGVNATVEPETIPYVQPSISLTSLVPHMFSEHTGLLDWSLVDTSVNKINLSTQASGVLPTSNQQSQTSVNTLSINTGTINNNSSQSGISNITTNVAYIRKIELINGTSAKLKLYDASGNLQYETNTVSTPFTDYGGYFLVDYSGFRTIKWEVFNYSGQATSFDLKLYLICFSATIVTTETIKEIPVLGIVKDENVQHNVDADGYISVSIEATADGYVS